MDCLLFRLYGPLASWGEIAVGENRHSAAYPGKSAIIGLLAAALGIKRDDRDGQKAMQDGYKIAVAASSRGRLLRDYQTTQVPDSVGNHTYRTRRDELTTGKSRLGNILSSREYRTDALSMVAVKLKSQAPFDLEILKSHLLSPKFILYLGRKSCPLAAPLCPQIVKHVDGFLEAFTTYKNRVSALENKEKKSIPLENALSPATEESVEYYWEGEGGFFFADGYFRPANTNTP